MSKKQDNNENEKEEPSKAAWALILESSRNNGGMGRPTKCTRELAEMIATLIANGSNIKDACAIVDIHVQSFYSWMGRGRNEMQRIYDLDQAGISSDVLLDEEDYLYFFELIEKAKPIRKMSLIERIQTAGKSQWQANAWLLERLHPDEFGRKVKVEHSDWRTEIIKLISEGKITFNILKDEIGENESTRLFERAGVSIITERESAETH